MTDLLDDILGRLNGMPEEARAAVEQQAMEATKDLRWIPNPGPQTQAYFSPADILLYGGQGGGGKTDLLAGLAVTKHKRSLLLRVQYTDLGAVVDRVAGVVGTRKGLNSSPPPQFKLGDGRVIDFGAASNLEKAETWQGNPHDFIGFDEACQFHENVVRFILGWNRAADEVLGQKSQQRSRAVLATNPPLSAEGDWIIGMFRPWLDPTHHNPAAHGELRWFVTDPDGKDMEVDGPEDIREWDGEQYIPTSRTFIPARLGDNPFLRETRYKATLDAMPEPIRSAIRDGNFMAFRADDEWQMIPTDWIREAQARWTPEPPDGIPMSSMGVDPAAGGTDRSIVARRHDAWFAELIEKPGIETPLGTEIAGLVVINRKDGAAVVVDMGGGYGGVPYMTLQGNGIEPVAWKGAEGSSARTKDRKLGFYNKRAEGYWRLREALDPSQDGGSWLALPPDQELLSELTSVRFQTVQHKGVLCVKAETKEDVVKRLGRSPDKADAVVMCWSSGEASQKGHRILPRDQRVGTGRQAPKVITSKMHRRGR